MNKGKVVVAGAGIITGLYLLTRGKAAAKEPLLLPAPKPSPPTAQESNAEKQAVVVFNTTQASNTILDQSYKKISNLPGLPTTPEMEARLWAAAKDLNEANAECAALKIQADDAVAYLEYLKNKMATASEDEYSDLLESYQITRATQLNLLNAYELARADAYRAGILYSQIRAGLA